MGGIATWIGKQSRRGAWDAAVAVLLLATVFAFWKLGSVAGCGTFHLHSQLTGDASILQKYIDGACKGLQQSDVQRALVMDFWFIPLYGVTLYLALTQWWKAGWRTKGFRNNGYVIRFFPLAAAAFDVIETIALLCLTHASATGTVVFEEPAWLISAFAWPKWLLLGISIGALALALIGAFGFLFRHIPNDPHHAEQPNQDGVVDEKLSPDKDIGICLSGGGIRSASFSLGAMEAFDKAGILDRTRWITSVSGGGYIASAWYIRGREKGLLQRNGPDPNLFKYIRKNRRYLATGRGGLPIALLSTFVGIALNILLLGTIVYLGAYPLGKFISSFAIQPSIREAESLITTTFVVPWRLWAPGVLPLCVALVATALSLPFWDPSRARFIKIAGVFAALGVTLILSLAVVPWLVASGPKLLKTLGELLPGGDSDKKSGAWFLAVLSSLGLTGALGRIAVKPLSKAAPRLGGVLLGIGVALLVCAIAIDSARDKGSFALSKTEFLAILGGFAAAYWLLDVQRATLNALYDNRLRTTFATTTCRLKRVIGAPGEAGVFPVRRSLEPNWDEYQTSDRPDLIICAAAQRKDDFVTGIPAVSFVFSSTEIGLYRSHLDESGKLCIDRSLVPTSQFVRAATG